MTKLDKFPDKIFVKGHLTTAERLLFAETEIKELKINNGKLLSEIEHLQNENLNLIANSALNKSDLIAIKTDSRVKELRACIKKQKLTITQLRKDNSSLINKVLILNKSNESK